MGDSFGEAYPPSARVSSSMFPDDSGAINSREFYAGIFQNGGWDAVPSRDASRKRASPSPLQYLMRSIAYSNTADISGILAQLERIPAILQEEQQNSGAAIQKGKPVVYEEQLYLSTIRAAAAGGFQEADKFRIEDIFYNLKQCGAVSKTFREFVQSGGKAKDTEDRRSPSALIYMSIVNNSFERTFSENALEWHEYFFGMRLFENFDWDCIPLDAFGDSVLTLMKCRVDKKIVSDSKKHICPFNYVEQVGEIADALDILRKAGAEKVSKNNISLYDSIRLGMKSNIRDYFEPETALKAISQEVLRHSAEMAETSLSVMRLIKELTDNNKVNSKISRIVEKYESPSHPWRNDADTSRKSLIEDEMKHLREKIPLPKKVEITFLKKEKERTPVGAKKIMLSAGCPC